MATFVCIHGAFQGGWVWKDTAQALFTLGHDVLAPTLSGCGYLAHGLGPGLGLGTYIRDVTQFFALEDLNDAILVAHSYSGLVCCGAMAEIAPRLAGAIFVDALLALPGHSFAGLAGEPFRAMLSARVRQGWLVDPWVAPLFGVAGDDRADWFLGRLFPFPLAAFTDATATAEPVFPPERHYVRCAANPNPLLAANAARAAELGFAMHAIDTGHCPQITAPVALARVLAAIAAGLAGAG
ncbi:alpha/beta fold hydrolase [Solidesulfovibrio sp.]